MPLVFNYQKSFGGSLFDFRYLPYEVSHKKIKSFYHNIPNVKQFTKLYRFKKYMQHYHFKKAITSIF